MKKKAIEKIPYLGLPRVIRKKNAQYVGVTALKDIDGTQHFFLEMYKNDKAHKTVPVVRIVVTKNDFGNYFPDSQTWSKQKCADNYTGNGMIWRNPVEQWKSPEVRRQENILNDSEDLELIKKYFSDIKVWNADNWWDFISMKQERITADARNAAHRRKYERRQQALKERIEATPQLPEAHILEYANQYIFSNKHYLYYKKHRKKATIACSSCGGVTEGRWQAGESYESQFEHLIQEPRMSSIGTCPMCGTSGTYMAQGKVKNGCSKKSHVFIGHKFKDTGMVFRYIEVTKRYELQLIAGEKEPEMYNAREVLEGAEIARAYVEQGKKIQIDYHKHNHWNGEDFWDDCNLSGLSSINVKEARVMPETYHNMQGTILQYSAMREYQEAAGEINPFKYAERYLQIPQIEMLVKLKLTTIVKNLFEGYYGIVKVQNATRPDTFLGIRKEKVKLLAANEGDEHMLKILQVEKRLEQNWTEEQIKALTEIRASGRHLELILPYMTVQKLINRVVKYAGCEIGTECSTAIARLQHIAGTYFDYLDMRRQLGYDLTNTVYQHPKRLQEAHNKMVAESNKKEADKRRQEVMERYPLIRKHYRTLRKKFFYEDEDYQIRPARSAEEIVQEGRILHHCVGGDSYLQKHNNGDSYILMLRFQKEPDIPYITVEVARNNNLIQWYGVHDKKPDKKNMEKWLDTYITRLKCGTLSADAAAGAAM